ncbi:hypothetical protein EVAR_28455_1 [Eumeta japonica]|uniref:Uncharacterized protein n=1 Tax=Eumeta variegata TaxID=151549 RepID=A0A4C1V8X7_EUMVA|nr:hypothetical protein EVAR_28455_1 [Eumeta japonica]
MGQGSRVEFEATAVGFACGRKPLKSSKYLLMQLLEGFININAPKNEKKWKIKNLFVDNEGSPTTVMMFVEEKWTKYKRYDHVFEPKPYTRGRECRRRNGRRITVAFRNVGGRRFICVDSAVEPQDLKRRIQLAPLDAAAGGPGSAAADVVAPSGPEALLVGASMSGWMLPRGSLSLSVEEIAVCTHDATHHL